MLLTPSQLRALPVGTRLRSITGRHPDERPRLPGLRRADEEYGIDFAHGASQVHVASPIAQTEIQIGLSV
jgi:hypothetical protein